MMLEIDASVFAKPRSRNMAMNPYDIGYKKSKQIKGGPGEGPNFRFNGLKKALKTANKTPQAVAKVIGFAKSAASAKNMVDYISRDGDLELTDQDDKILQDDDERKDLIDDWKSSFPTRKNGRFAMHYMVSTPVGSDHKSVIEASKAFAAANFAEYDFVMATHFDEPNPHSHFIVSRREGGPSLRVQKADLAKWRESWAEIGTEHGIPMIATQRIERGRGRKSKKARDIHIERREGTTKNDVKAAAELLSEWGKDAQHPWDKGLDNRLREERVKSEALIKDIELFAKSAGTEAPRLEATAKLLRRQSMALRQTMTRRDIMKHLINDPNIPVTPKSSPKQLALAYANSDGYMSKVLAPASEKTMTDSVKGGEALLATNAPTPARSATTTNKSDKKNIDRDFGI